MVAQEGDADAEPRSVFVQTKDIKIEVIVRYQPEKHEHDAYKKQLMETIEAQVETVMKGAEERALRPGMERVSNNPALEYHTWWLYLAMCPDPEKGRPLRFHEIADRHKLGDRRPYGEDTIAKAIGGKDGLASRLGITLPYKQGRPQTSEKT